METEIIETIITLTVTSALLGTVFAFLESFFGSGR